MAALPEFDPCSPSEFPKKVAQAWEDLKTDVERVIDDLSFVAFGKYLKVIGALIIFMAASAAINMAALAVASLVGNVVGTFNALVALGYSMVTGVRIMIRYLAAQFLIVQLTNRIKLTNMLQIDLRSLLEFFLSIQRIQSILGGPGPIVSDAEAIMHLDKASGLIRRNIGGEKKANNQDLQIALLELEQALDKITGIPAITPNVLNDILKLNQKYQIPVVKEKEVSAPTDRFASPAASVISIPDPLAFPRAIKEAIQHFKKDLWVVTLNEKGEEERELNPKAQEQIRGYLIDLIRTPGVGEIFKNIIISSYAKKKMDVLGERLPIKAVVARNLAKAGITSIGNKIKTLNDGALNVTSKMIGEDSKLTKVMNATNPVNIVSSVIDFTKEVESNLEDAAQYLDLGEAGESAYPSKANLGSYSALVTGAEVSILSLPSWEKVIVSRGVLVEKVFLPQALRSISAAKRTLTKLKETPNNSPSGLMDRTEAVGHVSAAKSYVGMSLERSIPFSFPGSGAQPTALSASEIDRQFQGSLNIWTSLEDKIFRRRAVITKSGKVYPRKSESEIILNVADEELSSFALGRLNLVSPKSRERLIAGLQSINMIMGRLLLNDQEELALANQFVSSVEANPLFQTVVKPAWDAFMKYLGTADLGKELIASLQNGQLGELAATYGTIAYGVSELAELSLCGQKFFDLKTEILFETLGGDSDKSKALITRAKRKIGELRDQEEKLDLMVAEIKEKTEQEIKAKKEAAAAAAEKARKEAELAGAQAKYEAELEEQNRLTAEDEAELEAANQEWMNFSPTLDSQRRNN